MWSKTQAWEMWPNGWPDCRMLSVQVSHTINNWCPQLGPPQLLLGQNPSGGWVCSSVWGQHCRKCHICREKIQLSRAKPGNPASTHISERIRGTTKVRKCPRQEVDVVRVYRHARRREDHQVGRRAMEVEVQGRRRRGRH